MKHSQIPLILLLALLLLTINLGCGSGPKQVVDETQGIDTTTAIPEDTVTEEETDAPQGIIKESQFETVYFDFDKSSLRSDSKSGLDSNYDLLMQFPDVMVKIEGHCDERGTVEYNLSLGEKRATSCMDYLVGLGIDASRISTISYGKEKPMDAGHSEAAWGKNRRCEFKIVSQ
ncbi:MAG: peptidoglycan-associated lipoprotein Pal [candidate division Zixibacteria bacterium]|nr:peptidoglycan-associated lipoprotein Pal [candidate division Zixibacteria bacterium]